MQACRVDTLKEIIGLIVFPKDDKEKVEINQVTNDKAILMTREGE